MGFTERLVTVLISLHYCSILVDSFPAVLTYDGFPSIRKRFLNPTSKLTLPENTLIPPPQINPGIAVGLDALSPSSCFAIASGEAEFTIQAELKDCGTKLWFTPDALIYTNNLIYSPVPFDGVIRLEGVVVPIECHYGRKYNTSNDLQPTWVPFIGTSSAEEILDFSLMLMSSDWLARRSSSIYFPGEMMYFEASVLASLMSLRVFVDYCVATLVPDWTTHPQYSFIENYGCLTDAKRTGSCSLFQPRSEDHKLRFQLEAFRFSQQASPSLYITCHLRAVPVTNTDWTNKACSFIEDSWRSADGNDGVCNSCQLYMESQGDSYDQPKIPMSNGGLWKRQTTKSNMAEWRKATTVGPVAILPSPGALSTNPLNQQACWDSAKQRIALNASVSTTLASVTTVEASVSSISPDGLDRK
ncbi:zona pellucida sperm-binding protein 3-like isoform X2 [Brienomyrus brachyistius]|uniref:zona pellucida sperm-binding protein 3-like isoform X2 n=1 Tax=Brienomyrus brachyistius TaxID=42636 RepID=UPI0020B331F7|nr:zona pellucida sperm-binding protein 3-like isoform X2 [Brienomyrus brachyistius]